MAATSRHTDQVKDIPLLMSHAAAQEIISLEECKQYIGEFPLTDQRIIDIRNNMIGIVDQILNTYLKNVG